MEKLINEFFTGIIILALFGGAHSCTEVLAKKASKAHKQGPMSYSKYTRMLTN